MKNCNWLKLCFLSGLSIVVSCIYLLIAILLFSIPFQMVEAFEMTHVAGKFLCVLGAIAWFGIVLIAGCLYWLTFDGLRKAIRDAWQGW